MPDFEALIRHQQLKESSTNKRLKVVETGNSNESTEKNQVLSTDPKLFNYFLAGFSGSLLGSGILLFLFENNIITFDLDTIYAILNLN